MCIHMTYLSVERKRERERRGGWRIGERERGGGIGEKEREREEGR